MNETYFLKLSGKVNIPEALKISENYKAVISGSVTSETRADDFNGELSVSFKFEPVTIELINDLGERIKAKDPRSLSKKWRSVVVWEAREQGLEEDATYEKVMNWIMANGKELITRALTSE